MKILVTGGTGFLGRHLVWRLASTQAEVVFTGRNGAAAAQVLAAVPQAHERVRYIGIDHGTAGAEDCLRDAAEGADAIVHCAALASPWGTKAAFRKGNVASTAEVLAACAAHRISRLVHVSTPSIYFDYRDRIGIAEDAPLPPPVNEYARSKREAERLVQAAALPHGVVLRPRAIFGPWDAALLPRLLRLMRHGRVPLLRGGRALLDMTYVDNAVDAVLLSLRVPAAARTRVYNISNGEPIAVAALFERIAAGFGVPVDTVHRPYWLADLAVRALELGARLAPGWEPPVTRYSLGTIAFSQTLDLKNARDGLGYAPAVSLDEGIARTAAWWKGQGA
ncbi:NAD-dependent epimerase/dehydratase family protein [Massilia dura]|uniref:NAD-dependent epimerase/dehydratase family protein n=1 Tax=Pseudoduganella dura TaxID=321982 RepID=A0A6I3X8A2_9BURK|nr:NAD(P)-dependent oxidoreductase [Pseudoduganella dura]MUI13024.1 NAD-dependent epimerase/dehydratase family protein [Pseudoduganella dura]GGX87809.1 3-beta hydroxysteroid dehydrogenase [Pseudoduganella dura]